MSTHTELPRGSLERWRAAQAEAMRLVRADRDREAIRILEREGLLLEDAARDVADMRERVWRHEREVAA